jgi:hypothetical protein
MHMIEKFNKEALTKITDEIIEICFPDCGISLKNNVEFIWGNKWTSCWYSNSTIEIRKRKNNMKRIERSIIHEIMHEIYRNLHHRSPHWKLLQEAYIELLDTVRQIVNGNSLSKELIKKAKDLRTKIDQLDSLYFKI